MTKEQLDSLVVMYINEGRATREVLSGMDASMMLLHDVTVKLLRQVEILTSEVTRISEVYSGT
jgi:hypothetical protein